MNQKFLSYIILCFSAVMSFMTAGCSNEYLPEKDNNTEMSVPKDGSVMLEYMVEDMKREGNSRSITPSEKETAINDITYLIYSAKTDNEQNESKWTNVGYFILPRMNLVGVNGHMEFKLPEDFDLKKKYKVLVIANLSFYTNLPIANWAATRFNESLSDSKKKLTNAGLKNKPTDTENELKSLKRDLFAGNNLLMTSEFDFTNGQNIPLLLFKRKNIAVNISFSDMGVSSINATVRKIKLKNVPLATALFVEYGDETSFFKGEVEIAVDSRLSSTTLYLLANTPNVEDMIKAELVILPKEDVITNNIGNNQMYRILSWQDAKQDRIIDFPLRVGMVDNHSGTYFGHNEYIELNFSPSLDETNKINLTVNDWLSGMTFEGKYIPDEDGVRGYAVSRTDLDFDFANNQPISTITKEKLPDGSSQREIFISGHGVIPQWNIKADAKPDWLTIENSRFKKSIIVKVEPNFNITTEGYIVSVPRSYNFEIIVGRAKFPITVSQKAAPLYPEDVLLPNGYTVCKRNSGASSGNFFTNMGSIIQTPVGDMNAKGTYLNNTTHRKSNGGNGVTSPGFFGDSSELNVLTAMNEGEIDEKMCRSKVGDGFVMPEANELSYMIFPYIKQIKKVVGNSLVTVNYIPYDGKICFLPYVGDYSAYSIDENANAKFKLFARFVWYAKNTVERRLITPVFNNNDKQWFYTGISVDDVVAKSVEGRGQNNPNDIFTSMIRCIKRPMKPVVNK